MSAVELATMAAEGYKMRMTGRGRQRFLQALTGPGLPALRVTKQGIVPGDKPGIVFDIPLYVPKLSRAEAGEIGSIVTDAKREAARENGRKGGRPKGAKDTRPRKRAEL